MAKVAQYVGQLYVAPGPGVTFTEEATTHNAGWTRFTITSQAKRYWDPDTPIVMEYSVDSGVNWITASSEAYAIEYCGGVIIVSAFVNGMIRVSGEYLAYAKAAGIKSFSLKLGHKMRDITDYNMEDEDYMPLSKKGTGSLKIEDVDDYYSDLLGERIVLIAHISGTYNTNDSSGPRYEMYARLSEDSWNIPVDDLITQDISFTVERERHFRST